MLTYLAIAFVLCLIAAIFYGFGIVLRRPPTKEDLQTASCFLCRRRFVLDELVERVIGDSKVVYFCFQCVSELQNDKESRSTSSSSA